MCRALRVLILAAALATVGAACASGDRPEVVPGSTISTSSTTTAPSPTTSEPASGGSTTTPTTSIPRLDPNDPDYPTTPPTSPPVTYPVAG